MRILRKGDRYALFLSGVLYLFSCFCPVFGQHNRTFKTAKVEENKKVADVLKAKQEYFLRFDIQRPLGSGGNGHTGNGVYAQSLLLGYQEGLLSQKIMATTAFTVGKFGLKGAEGLRIGCYNCPLIDLFRMAVYDGMLFLDKNRVLLEVSNPTALTNDNMSGTDYLDWMRAGNGFVYEAIAPVALGRKFLYNRMRDEMNTFFPQYEFDVVKRKTPCLILKRISTADLLATKGGEAYASHSLFGFEMRNAYDLQYLINRLRFYMQLELPIVDKTEYEGKVDMHLAATMSNVEDVNRALTAYGLMLVYGEEIMDMLVIRDTNLKNPLQPLNKELYQNLPRGFDWENLIEGGSAL